MKLKLDPKMDFSNYQLGSRPEVENGWHTIKVLDVLPPTREANGYAVSTRFIYELENGQTFTELYCVECTLDKYAWRVENSSAFLSYLAKCAKICPSTLRDFIGARVEAYIETIKRSYRDKKGTYKATTIKQRGALSEVLKAV